MLAFPSPTNSLTKSAPNSQFGRSASLILPRLYLSDLFTARDENVLSKLGITHVVSVIEFSPTLPASIVDENKLHLGIADRADVDVLAHLGDTTEFISRALNDNPESKVLVHCVKGISRSATVVCAYVIATSDSSMTASDAIAFVQSKRGIVCPNLGFRIQLESYATRFVGHRANGEKSIPHRTVISTSIAQRIRQLKRGNHSQQAKEAEAEGPEVT